MRVSSTAGSRSATGTRVASAAATATQIPEGGAKEEGAKGFSQSDKIALGCGIGVGLPTLLVAM